MPASQWDGPIGVYGNMAQIGPAYGEAVGDQNLDAGPSWFFQGYGVPDVRFPMPKDKVTGFTGMVPMMLANNEYVSADVIPSAINASSIAAAQNVANGVALTLAGASLGWAPGVPIRPNTAAAMWEGSGAVTLAGVIDMGFSFAALTANNQQLTVDDSTKYYAGMPLVIPGGAGVGAALLTLVSGIVDATHITVVTAPSVTLASAPVGMGDLWGPSEAGFPVPDAHLPYLAQGPGLFLDPRQALMRGISITGAASSTGGNFLVKGYDAFWNPQSEIVAVPAAGTGKTKKTYKAIASITPQFTDAHNYNVGTADLYGLAVRADLWEYQSLYWAGAFITSATGFTKADLTNPATTGTGDPRGTYATQSASTGALTGLVMGGNRLVMFSELPLWNTLSAEPASPQFMFGVPPV